LIDEGSCPSAAAAAGATALACTWELPAPASAAAASAASDCSMLRPTAAAVPATPPAGKGLLAGAMTPAGARSSSCGGARSSSGGGARPGKPQGPRKPVALTEVSTSGGLAQSVMQQSAQSVLDEVDVTLG
jgi:hypothetical protein